MNYIRFPQGENILKLPMDYDILKKGKTAFDANYQYKEAFLKNFFAELKDVLYSKFLNSINNGCGLIRYNEKIYDYYKRIIDYYKTAVEVYDLKKGEIVSEEVIQIANGIEDILECQINKFDEVNEKTGNQSNPIFEEKEKIIDMNLKMFSKDILIIYEKIGADFDGLNIEDYFMDIYKMYFSAVKNCFIQLNDIDSRRIASMYYEFLKQEWESLSVIIKVQADVLERKTQYPEEYTVIQSFLMSLREGYQHLSKQINEMEKGFKEAVFYGDFINQFDDDFKKEIILCFKKSKKGSEDYKKHFEYCNSGFIEKLKDNFEEVARIEKIEAKIEEMIFFAEKIISKFQFLYNYWKLNSENYRETDFNEIIVGISETVNIKIQNIREGIFEFTDKSKEIIMKIPASEKYDKLFIFCKDFDEKSDDIDNYVNGIIIKFDKLFNKYRDISNKIEKLILSLKRDSILFEVSTFEEIMNYSVSRMRNSQNMYVEEFVQNMDFVFDELNQVLSVVGVEIIAPKPHDAFNGKEHEVIMAEKNSDFKKGEVIKLMNSGYKEGKYVILRANIIAAK